jgi:hypothetical protein
MRWTIALLIAVFACSAAQAEVFEWVDPQGVTHFTDDLNKVPAQYREKVKRRAPVTGEKGAAPESPPPGPESAPGAQKAESYGGHGENWWRASFKALRDEMKGIQDKLPGKREELTRLHRRWLISMGRTPKAGESTSDPDSYATKSALSTPGQHRVAYYDMKGEIEKDEARIKEIEDQLTSLDAEATRAGVPFEWRK